MNDSDIIRFSSALMQFGVACYALRLGRIFNTSRVGWLVFSTLSLLAVLYFLVPTSLLNGFIPLGIKVDLVYALVSVVLILGMVYLDISSKKRRQAEQQERKAQSEFEAQVDTKWAVLTKSNQELREASTRMSAELAQHKQAREESEKALQEQAATARQVEEDLRQTLAKLQAEAAAPKTEMVQKESLEEVEKTWQAKLQAAEEQVNTIRNQLAASMEQLAGANEQAAANQAQWTESQNQLGESRNAIASVQQQLDAIREELTAARASEQNLKTAIADLEAAVAEQKRASEEAERAHQETLAASRQAGIADAAANLVPHIAGVVEGLNSVSASAQDWAKSSLTQVSRIGKLMRQPSRAKKAAVKRPPLDRQLRDSLMLLSRRISDEQLQLARKIGVVKKKVGDLRQSAAIPAETPANEPETALEIAEAAPETAEVITETATSIDPAVETPVVTTEETPAPAPEEVSASIAESTPIQIDEPAAFDGGLTLENYHDMTVSTVDLGEHLIPNMTQTGTEPSPMDELASSPEVSNETTETIRVHSDQ